MSALTPDPALPPGVAANGHVVLFDGVCKLCGAWARFIIRHDRRCRFKLASVQSPEGQAILAWYGLPLDRYDSVLLVEGARLSLKSSAFVRLMRGLPFPWPLLAAVWLVPRPLRDWLYDRVALNRYTWFGRHDTCLLPTPDHEARFLHARD